MRILGYVDVRNTGLEEGQLKISHFLPIDDFCIEIKIQLVDENVDIVYCQLGIPTAIDMKNQWSQTEFPDHLMQHEGAVNPAA